MSSTSLVRAAYAIAILHLGSYLKILTPLTDASDALMEVGIFSPKICILPP